MQKDKSSKSNTEYLKLTSERNKKKNNVRVKKASVN